MTVHVIGNATLDHRYTIDHLPDPGETCLVSDRDVGPGGKGLNQAVAAARAGAATVLHAPIGSDEAGRRLEGVLTRQRGLAVRWWRRDGPSDESCIWIDRAGENAIVSTARCAASVTPREVEVALAGAAPRDTLVLQGNLAEAATAAALVAGRAGGMRTILNPAPFRFDIAALAPHLDLLVVNRPEAAQLGLRGLDREGPACAARLGCTLVVTLGAAGLHAFAPDGTVTARAARPVRPVDTTGAGDAFVGTLAASLDGGAGLDDALSAALEAGTRAVEHRGALAVG